MPKVQFSERNDNERESNFDLETSAQAVLEVVSSFYVQILFLCFKSNLTSQYLTGKCIRLKGRQLGWIELHE